METGILVELPPDLLAEVRKLAAEEFWPVAVAVEHLIRRGSRAIREDGNADAEPTR